MLVDDIDSAIIESRQAGIELVGERKTTDGGSPGSTFVLRMARSSTSATVRIGDDHDPRRIEPPGPRVSQQGKATRTSTITWSH
jgi:hypothetical protein